MELRFGKKKETPFLVLDIGTEAVKMIIVKKDNKKVSILGSSLQYYRDEGIFNRSFSEEEFEMEIIKRAVFQAKKEVLSSTSLKEKIKEPLPIVLTLNPKMLKAVVVEGFSVRDKKEKKISKKEKEIIYKYVLKATKDDIFKKVFEKSGILSKDISFLFLEIIDREIDGYRVSDIQDYRGKNLNFKVLAVFVFNRYLEGMHRMLEENGMKIIKTVHLAEAMMSIFSEKVEDRVFLDIGGEVTQVFFIKNKVLEKIDLFNRGGANFTERILDVLATNKDEARILKEKYSKGSLTSETEGRIKDIFSVERKVWRDILKKYQRSSVFLFGGGSVIREVKDVFQRRKIIDTDYFKKVQDLTKKTKSPQFIPSILISLLP